MFTLSVSNAIYHIQARKGSILLMGVLMLLCFSGGVRAKEADEINVEDGVVFFKLCDFGSVDTPGSAAETFEKAVKKIVEKGGGLLVVSSKTHMGFTPGSFTQTVAPEKDFNSLNTARTVTILSHNHWNRIAVRRGRPGSWRLNTL